MRAFVQFFMLLHITFLTIVKMYCCEFYITVSVITRRKDIGQEFVHIDHSFISKS